MFCKDFGPVARLERRFNHEEHEVATKGLTGAEAVAGDFISTIE
jgi:hypothetical protein